MAAIDEGDAQDKGGDEAMQSQNRILDDLARVAAGAMSTCQG